MTTIACDRKLMAGDTLLCADTKANATKVFKHKGAVVGVAGTYVHCMEFVKWWRDGAQGDTPDMEEVDAIVLTKDGRILCFNHHHAFFEITDSFTAIGSGAAAALGAMHAGADPAAAIKIASKVDMFTGGKPTIRRRGTRDGR